MTRIDFYILPDEKTDPSEAVITACRLCDKAVSAGLRIFAFIPDEVVAQKFDSALWSFRQGAFLTHEPFSGSLQEPLPMILISSAEPPADYAQVMINFDAAVPAFFSRFERVLEIVHGDPAMRAQSRARFKYYRDRGYELASNKL